MKSSRLVKKGFIVFAGLLLTKTVLAETLQGALRETLTTNPDIQITVKDRLAIKQALRQAKSGYLPTLDATAGYGREHTDLPYATSPLIPSLDESNQTLTRAESGLAADQMLFDGFATSNEVKRNKARFCSASYKIAGTAEDTALKATEAYLDVLREQKLITLAQQNMGSHDKIFTLINKRSEGGVSDKADSTEASGRLALAKTNLASEKANLIDAQSNYMQIVGSVPQNLVMPVAPDRRLLPATEESAIKEALANHPTLKSAKQDMIATYAQHKAATSKNYPRFDLQLSADRDHNVGGIEGINESDQAMVRMNYNLYHGGADKARQDETAYLYQESAEVMHKTYLQVINNAQLSWNAWQVAQKQLPLLKQHRDQSLQTFKSFQQQFQLNHRTLLDLLDAQNEYYDASRAYVNGQFNLLFAQYRVLNSTGALLQTLHVGLPT